MRNAGLIAIIAAMVIIAAMCMISNTIDSIENNHPEAVVAAAEQDNRVLVEVLYDKYDNIIQKTTRDEVTGMTIIYTFTYEQQNGYHVCIDSNVTILGPNGDIIKD